MRRKHASIGIGLIPILTRVREIIAGEYFSDNLPDIASCGKDVSVHLRGHWLIEVSELHSLSRAEAHTLKAFISRKVEIYRPPYGRLEVREPRQTVFVGTTNKTNYLKDETGGRRFWPIRCGTINIAALQDDRDQLFAEAMELYRAGRHWWPDKAFEQKHIVPQQSQRYESDVWEENIHAPEKTQVTIGQVAREAIGLETPRIGRADQNRIAAALEQLGWHRLPKDWKGNRPWGKA